MTDPRADTIRQALERQPLARAHPDDPGWKSRADALAALDGLLADAAEHRNKVAEANEAYFKMRQERDNALNDAVGWRNNSNGHAARVATLETALREIESCISLNSDGTADSYDGSANPVILIAARAALAAPAPAEGTT